MANQHTLTIPLSQATERQLLVHIASRMENHMADMTAALDRLSTSLAKEIADIRDDLLGQIANLSDESQAAKDALAAKVAELDGAVARVEGMADDLDANDAPAQPEQPEQPVEPAPTDPQPPTDPETPAVPEQPVEPGTDPEQPTEPTEPTQPVEPVTDPRDPTTPRPEPTTDPAPEPAQPQQ